MIWTQHLVHIQTALIELKDGLCCWLYSLMTQQISLGQLHIQDTLHLKE